MEIGYGIIICTILVLIFATYFFMRKLKKGDQFSGKLRLPPGSMGLPYVGETLQLYSQDPNVFFINKQKRFGEIFKTHVLGCPCVMLASPEAARFVLVKHSNLFKPTYPRSKEQMIGPSALFFNQGEYHMRIRRLVQSCLAPEALRAIVPEIERIVVSMLESLGHGQVINTFHAMKKFSFDVGILTIFGGKLEAKYKVELKKNYFIVDKGYNSFPTNIPGTHYSKAIKARKRLSELLSEIMNERRTNGKVEKDLLGYLMESKDNETGSKLSDEQISDNIIGVLFAAQDTTASVLTWILKYLGEDPKLLEAVKVEQMAIYATNECGSQPLTWAQTRAMTLTNKVVLETLRMASIISFTFREAVADVEFKGFLIPKGWKVMPLFRNIHYNPDFFPEPHKFEPSRFSSAPKPNTFLPFGSGVHACPGNELAKLEILILLHHLVTKYRFEVMGPNNEIEYNPFPIPKRGLPLRVWRAELGHGA